MIYLTKVSFDSQNVPFISAYFLEADRRKAPRDSNGNEAPTLTPHPALLVLTLAEPFLFGKEDKPTEAFASDGRTLRGSAHGLLASDGPGQPRCSTPLRLPAHLV
jgi:hypothetical protein